MSKNTCDWRSLAAGQEILIDGIEYKIVLKTIEKIVKPPYNRGVLYLESPYTNERVMAELQEDGSFDFIRNPDVKPTEKGKPLTPDMMVYMMWDDGDLKKAIEDLNKPFDVLHALTIWKDKMKCGHRVRKYEAFIDGEDNIVRIRFICVEGCLTEWFKMGKIPLPHEHEMSLIKKV